jgi:hypothetical protein
MEESIFERFFSHIDTTNVRGVLTFNQNKYTGYFSGTNTPFEGIDQYASARFWDNNGHDQEIGTIFFNNIQAMFRQETGYFTTYEHAIDGFGLDFGGTANVVEIDEEIINDRIYLDTLALPQQIVCTSAQRGDTISRSRTQDYTVTWTPDNSGVPSYVTIHIMLKYTDSTTVIGGVGGGIVSDSLGSFTIPAERFSSELQLKRATIVLTRYGLRTIDVAGWRKVAIAGKTTHSIDVEIGQ